MIWGLCRANYWRVAVCALFMLVTCVRPSEPLELLKEDLLAPAHGLSAPWICFALGQERGQASTCATDESIDLSCHAYARQFKLVCKKLGATAVPFQARHSGASIDAAVNCRARA
eukprot:4364201-Pyramimonas_sp.AAC.1